MGNLRNKGAVLTLQVALGLSALTSSMAIAQDFQGFGWGGAVLYLPQTRGSSPGGMSNTAMGHVDGSLTYMPNMYPAGYDTLRACDYNGDGMADLIVYNSQTALAYIGMGNGFGNFALQSLFWSPGYNVVECGDINGDGKADVALYNSTTGSCMAR